VKNFTSSREWTKETNQQSAPIQLVAGRRYYIEAVHIATTGGDNLAVGWQLPDQTLERPIPGSRLSAWSDPFAHSSRQTLTLHFNAGITGKANVLVVATDANGKSVTNRFAVTVSLPIAANAPNLTAMLSNGNLVLSWPTDHVGWQLEQASFLSAGLNSKWAALPGSVETNVWTSVLNSSNPSSFYRLSLPNE
jgi:hypothetical protein